MDEMMVHHQDRVVRGGDRPGNHQAQRTDGPGILDPRR